MKILITGGTGQLGRDCVKVLENNHRVVSVGSKVLDIGDRQAVTTFIKKEKPNAIVNCAAFTQVDKCETKKDVAWRVNAEGPRNLAAAARKTDSQLIHISTDYVFDGKKPVPEVYTEQDKTGPINYYGITKLAAEKAVAQETDRFAILRTAWMYGIGGPNFLKTMLRLTLPDPNRQIHVVNDQFGAPTWSYRLALQIARLLESDGQGIYHATSEGYCTWYELASEFLNRMEVPHSLGPCTTPEYPTPAERPMNSILENRRLKESGINLMVDWKQDVREFVIRFKDRLIKEARGERL